MNFFEHQDAARTRTSLLVFYFACAVVTIVITVYVVIAGLTLDQDHRQHRRIDRDQPPAIEAIDRWWNPELFGVVAAATSAVIALGSLYQISVLASGGEAVCRMLGGRPVDPSSTDRNERRLLNVVEEMAIASGVPVPPVYLLDQEMGINAFAAGFSPGNAAIGVTRGTLLRLNRDEMQGVMAHEFSHILNGDMRLNIRLMGLLHGILLIGLIGYWSFRIGSSIRPSRSSDGKNNNGAQLVFVLAGLAIWLIGSLGVFFGKLIKAAVSRQREFLADASAVQFTRNPDGLGNALKKIGGFVRHGQIDNLHASEASHLFFANALTSSFLQLLATHPPIEERIRRIDPNWDGTFLDLTQVDSEAEQAAHYEEAPLNLAKGFTPNRSAAAIASGLTDIGPTKIPLNVGQVAQQAGGPDSRHLEYAGSILASLPNAVKDAAREPFRARAVVYLLLMNRDPTVRNEQLETIAGADRPAFEEVQRLASVVGTLGPEARLPLASLCLPALAQLSEPQYRQFAATIDRLALADQRTDLFEYVLKRMMQRHLAAKFDSQRPPAVQYDSVFSVLLPSGALLSSLAYLGQRDSAAAETAFERGAERLQSSGSAPRMMPRNECGLDAVDRSLAMLAASTGKVKKRVLDACVATVAADGQVTFAEAELLRAVADSLDCPMPPLLGSSDS